MMSIQEIKQLFYEGLNSKAVIMGSDLAESALRKAVELSDSVKDDIWSNLPKYRLAHLLFVVPRKEFDSGFMFVVGLIAQPFP